jgi:hypothetical protein
MLLRAMCVLALAGVMGGSARSEAAPTLPRTPVLLELFTSEGCSSCPPADRLLETLDEKQPFPGADLIVLSEHVDYWNGDGWVDPYSSRLFSDRQKAYADHLGVDTVYTPQIVVDGTREMPGGDANGIGKAVQAAIHKQKTALMLTNIVREGNRITFHLNSGDVPATEGSVTVYVALAENKVQSHVGGGENGGRSLAHVAVARSVTSIATVKPGSAVSQNVSVPIPTTAAGTQFRVVTFLRANGSRRIVGAASQKVQ